MPKTTSLFLSFPLLAACADGPGDPNRQPPGPAGDDAGESSSSDDGGDTAMPDDDGTSGGPPDDADADTSSSDGAPQEMPCTDLCLPLAPSGWHGPAAFMRTNGLEPAPECGDTHPTALASFVSDLIAQPAECGCNCGEAEGATCNAASARAYSDASCSSLLGGFDVGLGCTNQIDPVEGYWRIVFDPPSGGECQALPAFTIPALDHSRWTLCGAEQSEGTCEFGESCTSTPGEAFDRSQCIWREGDVACPGDVFTERTVVYSEIVDDRSCAECSCSAPQGTCAGGQVDLHMVDNCEGGEWFTWHAEQNDCYGEIYFESGEIIDVATPFASCEPTMPESLGNASLEQPHTLCCAAA
jgi:hypothetical protein